MVKLQPGDIINVHSNGFSLLRLLTGLYWNHTLMIDESIGDDYGILESIDKGPAAPLLSNYRGQEIAVYRYKGISLDQQERLRLIARQKAKYKYDFLIPVRTIQRVGLRKGIKLIIQLLNKEYPLEIPHIQDSYVVCSEYIQEIYAEAGIPLCDNRYFLTPDAVQLCVCLECVFRGELS